MDAHQMPAPNVERAVMRGSLSSAAITICCFVYFRVPPRDVPTDLSKLRVIAGLLYVFFLSYGHFTLHLICLLINYIVSEGREMAKDDFKEKDDPSRAAWAEDQRD